MLVIEEVDQQSAARWGLGGVSVAAGLFLLWHLALNPDSSDAPFWVWIFPPIFLLSGLSILNKLVRKLADRLRYGPVALRLDGPAQVGGHLSGMIDVGFPKRVGKLRWTLSCESTVWTLVKSKDSEGNETLDRSATKRDLWGVNGTLSPDAEGVLRIEVSLPADLPAFSYPGKFGEPGVIDFGRTYCRWSLQLRTYGEVVNLRRTIRVPVSAASGANGAPRR